jgi:hypothetical protein
MGTHNAKPTIWANAGCPHSQVSTDTNGVRFLFDIEEVRRWLSWQPGRTTYADLAAGLGMSAYRFAHARDCYLRRVNHAGPITPGILAAIVRDCEEWKESSEAARMAGVSRKVVERLCRYNQISHRHEDGCNRQVHVPSLMAWKNTPAKAKPWRNGKRANPNDARGGFIYGLVDPRTNEIRYIGQAVNLRKRKTDYRREFRLLHTNRPVTQWFKKLKGLGLAYRFKVLDHCLFGLNALERRWIAKGRHVTDGGEVMAGWNGVEGRQRRELLASITRNLFKDPAYVARWEAGCARRFGLTVEEYRARQAASAERKVSMAKGGAA